MKRDVDDGAATLLEAEWLVTNGLGGFSSGTVAGVNTRRYHGLLVAALPNPIGRLVMLNHLGERACVAGGEPTALGGEERAAGKLDREVARRLAAFRLEAGLPVWEYEWLGVRIEKRVVPLVADAQPRDAGEPRDPARRRPGHRRRVRHVDRVLDDERVR